MTGRETIIELAEAIGAHRVHAADVVRACFDRIKSGDGELNCFRELYEQRATAEAEAMDSRLRAGEHLTDLPLRGIPIAIKDNMVTEFGRTSCGSRMLENFHSPYTATAVKRLMSAGAIIVGKTNMDEFAMGSSNENCAFGPTRNPHDVERVPGGSSGGSAAAVAAAFVPGALGSDTGGSVREPAALCGVVGVKPTYGLVSRYGLIAFGSSLDQIGPFARTVKDAALLLGVIAGPDPGDSTCVGWGERSERHSSPGSAGFTSHRLDLPALLNSIDEPVPNLRLGVPRQFVGGANEADVADAFEGAIEIYRELGAEIIDLDLPLLDYSIATYYVIAPAEASSNLARYEGIRYGHRAADARDLFDLYAKSRAHGLGPEVRRRIMLGTYVLSSGYCEAFYKRALQARRLITREFDRAFDRCHAIIGPTSPSVAFPLGSKRDPMSMYLSDVYTTAANISGICGISIPIAMSAAHGKPLPIGLQIQCPSFGELTMFRIARMLEAASGFTTETPYTRRN